MKAQVSERRVFITALSMVAILLTASPVPGVTAKGTPALSRHVLVVTCPFGHGGDNLSRGFYVSDYPADNIHSITLGYSSDYQHGDGMVTVALVARKRRYDGPVLTKVTETFQIPSDIRAVTRVNFDFRDVRVRQGSRITFTQRQLDGPASLYYAVGHGPLGDPSYDGCPGVTETGWHQPPLSRFRRASVGLAIRAAVA